MQLGSTAQSTKDYDDDCTLEELRGPSKQHKATLEGVLLELDIMKQKFVNMSNNQEKMIGLVMTLQGRLEAINEARVRELQARGTGPTS